MIFTFCFQSWIVRIIGVTGFKYTSFPSQNADAKLSSGSQPWGGRGEEWKKKFKRKLSLFLKLFVEVFYQLCLLATLFSPILLLFSLNSFQENIFSLLIIFFQTILLNTCLLLLWWILSFTYSFAGFASQCSGSTSSGYIKQCKIKTIRLKYLSKRQHFPMQLSLRHCNNLIF